MAESWSIKIIQQHPDDPVTFKPDVPGAVAGQPLGVRSGDNVTWNNRTNQTVTLQSIDPPGEYLTEPIEAGKVSSPIYVATRSVTYSCKTPAQPQHRIVVT